MVRSSTSPARCPDRSRWKKLCRSTAATSTCGPRASTWSSTTSISLGHWARSAPCSVPPGSTSTRPSCPKTPRVRARRTCCGWTATFPLTCGRQSVRPSTPTNSKWLTCREAPRRQNKFERCGGGTTRLRGRAALMKLAVIAGDGIGPEVVAEAVRVLDAVLPELRAHDAILLGAIGDPSVPSGVLERGLLLRLRFELDHHVNLRPARLYPGVSSPLAGNPDIDFVVVREGTEGPYAGNGGAIRVGTPHEVATEVSVNTAFGVQRVVKDAFERAQQRRKHLTLTHKTNVLNFAGKLWSRVVA